VPVYDSAPHDTVHALIQHFADVSRHFHVSEDVDESMHRITTAARDAIGGCESASISLLRRGGVETRGATDQLSRDGDQIQYEQGEGPCLDAAMEGRWLYEPDLRAEPRWPRTARRLVDELGIRSMFSCRLALEVAPNKTLGGINLYATRTYAFSEQDQMLAILLASLGAVVINGAQQQEQLRAAIKSRQLIGEAVGILRAKHDLDSQQAFEMLSKASQRMNVKLRELAQRISDGGRNGSARPESDSAARRLDESREAVGP